MDERIAMVIQEKAVDWPGIGIEIQPLRDYPSGSLTAALVGFLGPVPAILEDYYVIKGLVGFSMKLLYSFKRGLCKDFSSGRSERGLSVYQFPLEFENDVKRVKFSLNP